MGILSIGPVMKRGFTLIELLVVVAIIGILAAMVLAGIQTGRNKAIDVRYKEELKQYATALEMYYNKYGHYPQIDPACDQGSWGYSWCTNFIDGLEEFMGPLRLNTLDDFMMYSSRGYVDNNRSYKLLVARTHGEVVPRTSPFAYCPAMCGTGTWCNDNYASMKDWFEGVYAVSSGNPAMCDY